MLGNSIPEYVFIRLAIIALRLVAPTSLLYLATAAWTLSLPISPWVAVWAVAEAVFYLGVWLPRKRRLQAPPPWRPPGMTREEREKLFWKCVDRSHEGSGSGVMDVERCAEYVRGWFLPLGKPVRKREVVEWVMWAFFGVGAEEEGVEEVEEEVNGYVRVIEGILGYQLEDGLEGEGARGMRPTVDPVKVLHRPLVWYSIVGFVDAFTTLKLASMGFKHHSSRKWFETFPPRPLLSLLSHRHAGYGSGDEISLPYWYRPHKSPNKLPILFIHGIGIGLFPYTPLVRSLIAQDPDVGILLVELLPISMHMTSSLIPPSPVLVKTLNAILESHGISRVVLAAHSYGTFLASTVLRRPFHSSSGGGYDQDGDVELEARTKLLNKLADVLLIDPVSILLHFPAVAHNFLYRAPREASEWQLWYFASTDGDVARTLGRGMFWEEGAVWKDDLKRIMRGEDGADGVHYGDGVNGGMGGRKKCRNLAVVLAGKDQIVPAEIVRRYLTDDSEPMERWRAKGWGGDDVDGGDLEVLYHAGLDHATALDTPGSRRDILDVLHTFVVR